MSLSGEHVHSRHIDYLDGWRGLALLTVLVGHFLPQNGFAEWLAVIGVELFFVLSGRLMADILYVENYPLAPFFKRRFSRIFPGLLVFVIATDLATRGTALSFKPVAAAAALTFTINYAVLLHHGVAAIENLWSLCIEEHAYLLLGLLAFLARRRSLSPAVAISMIAVLSLADATFSTLVLQQDYRAVYWRSDAHVASILVAAAAYLVLQKRTVPSWVPIIAFLGAIAASAASDPIRYSLGTALFAVTVCSLRVAPGAVQRALSWKPLMMIGIWSYSIYLYQQPFFRFSLLGTIPQLPAAILAVAAGALSFYCVEQPARRWLNRHWIAKPWRAEDDDTAVVEVSPA